MGAPAERVPWAALIAAILLSACAAGREGAGIDSEARRKLDLARRLEAAGAFREAAHQYTMVAEEFPEGEVFRTAARRAALLYASPLSPARNDTAARRWLGAVLARDPPREEREALETIMALLRTLAEVRTESARMALVADSLAMLARRQGTALTAQIRRTSDLEVQLQHAVEELERLKEIDVQVSKSRRRR